MQIRERATPKGNGWGVCQRCEWKYDLADIKKEWTNLKVCPTCLDPRPANLSPPSIGPEGLASKNASPEPAFTEAGSATVGWGVDAGTTASTTVTVTGAAVGDGKAYTPYMDDGWGGLLAWAVVTAPNTVTVYAKNPTVSHINVAVGTLTITAV